MKEVFAVWCMAIMMIMLTVLVGVLIWLVVDCIRRSRRL